MPKQVVVIQVLGFQNSEENGMVCQSEVKNIDQMKIGPCVKIDPTFLSLRNMLVVKDRGQKMLNWWIVIPVLARLHIPDPPKISMKIKLYSKLPQLDPVFVADVREITK